MIKLKDLVASLLTEVAEAQHKANLYSILLATQYDQLPSGMRPGAPTATIDGMELDLRFAYVDAPEQSAVPASDSPEHVEAAGMEAMVPAATVCIDADALGKLPPHAVQTLHIKISTRPAAKE